MTYFPLRSIAVEKGNVDAMNNLALHYRNNGDTELMMKYYLEAVEKDDSDALFNIGSYWEDEENYENMKVPTKINCKVKNVAEDDIITYDMSEKKLKKFRNKIKQEKNAVENNKNKMKTEIKDKITEFLQFYVNIDRKTANNIINYYVYRLSYK